MLCIPRCVVGEALTNGRSSFYLTHPPPTTSACGLNPTCTPASIQIAQSSSKVLDSNGMTAQPRFPPTGPQ